MPAPLTTTFIALGAVITAESALAGLIVAGLGAVLELVIAVTTPPSDGLG